MPLTRPATALGRTQSGDPFSQGAAVRNPSYAESMSRLRRVVVPGAPHHVTQRGVRRMTVFYAAADYQLYRSLLGESSRRHGVEIWSYCLMPNHVHLIAVPDSPHSLARALQQAHARYAEILNRRAGWSGHLWQQRFSSAPMDGRHLVFAARYVLRNPVRGLLVARALDWPWSSAAAHAGLVDDPVVLDPKRLLSRVPDLLARLEEADDEDSLGEIRARTLTGRPLGDDGFILDLEDRLGRALAPRRGGRPPRSGPRLDSA